MKRKKDEEGERNGEKEKKWREKKNGEKHTINEWVKKKDTKRALPPFLSSSLVSFLLSIHFSSSGKVFKERRRSYQIQLVSEWKEVRR